MELIDNRPDMAKFTAPNDVTIVAKDGSMCAVFEAGETFSIRKELFEAALAGGLVPEEPLEILAAPPEVEIVVKSEDDVHTGLIEACKALIIRGNPDDFVLGSGRPRAASVKKLVDFNFTTKDIERAFSEAMHEVEQNDDDSAEHPEPSSESAE